MFGLHWTAVATFRVFPVTPFAVHIPLSALHVPNSTFHTPTLERTSSSEGEVSRGRTGSAVCFARHEHHSTARTSAFERGRSRKRDVSLKWVSPKPARPRTKPCFSLESPCKVLNQNPVRGVLEIHYNH